MIYVLLFLAFIFAVAFIQLNGNRKRQMQKQLELSSFVIEAPCRIRIYNDSMHILETTNIASTFISRVQEVVGFQDWAAIQIRKGMPLKTDGSMLQSRSECNEFINRNALRVALAEFALFSKTDRVRGAKMDKAAARAFEATDGLASCLKTADNQNEIKSELENIRNLIEDIYSNII